MRAAFLISLTARSRLSLQAPWEGSSWHVDYVHRSVRTRNSRCAAWRSGIALAKDLPAGDVLRLLHLSLIEDHGERFGLTALDRERYEHLHETISGAPDNTIDDKVARSLRVIARDMLK